MHVIVYFLSTYKMHPFPFAVKKYAFFSPRKKVLDQSQIVSMTFSVLVLPISFSFVAGVTASRERESLSDRGEKEDRGEGKKVSLLPVQRPPFPPGLEIDPGTSKGVLRQTFSNIIQRAVDFDFI